MFDLDKDAVKKNAENGALHYLQHALNHREELLTENIDIVLSVGASFDDDGGFIATPYYADATTGRIQRLHQFSRAFYFQPKVLEYNISYMRKRLRSGERDNGAWSDIRHQLNTMRIQPYERNVVPIMCLLWAMSYPRFIGSRLDRSNTFDTVLEYCQEMEHHYTKDEYKEIIGSFRTGNENAYLIPALDLARIERFIESETHITPFDYWKTAIQTFGLTEYFVRGRMIASALSGMDFEGIVDVDDPYGLSGTVVLSDLKLREDRLVYMRDDPLETLTALAQLNLFGCKHHRIIGTDDRKGIGLRRRCVIGDLTHYDDGLERMEDAMSVVSKGCFGIFTISREQAMSTTARSIGIRNGLNSRYTLRQLVGCRSFFLAVIEKTPNTDGGTTRFSDGPRTSPDNLLAGYQERSLSFGNRKLKEGIWVEKKAARKSPAECGTEKDARRPKKKKTSSISKEVEINKSQPERKKVPPNKIMVRNNMR